MNPCKKHKNIKGDACLICLMNEITRIEKENAELKQSNERLKQALREAMEALEQKMEDER